MLTYVLPVVAMAVSYSRMGRVLWGSQSIGELSSRQLESIQSKRKVICILLHIWWCVVVGGSLLLLENSEIISTFC